MKKFKIKIQGITPYMQHRMDDTTLETWEKNRKLIIERPDVSKEDYAKAMFHSYFDEETKKFFIPAEQLMGALIGAGCLRKGKVGNAKKSMKNIVSAMFQVSPEKIFLANGFAIDKRSAVNRNIKARVIVIRPRWENWDAEFELLVDNDTITNETIKGITEDAGNYIGIGSFRPSSGGRFGRFKILEFTEEIE
jgi:hypothetical protein